MEGVAIIVGLEDGATKNGRDHDDNQTCKASNQNVSR